MRRVREELPSLVERGFDPAQQVIDHRREITQLIARVADGQSLVKARGADGSRTAAHLGHWREGTLRQSVAADDREAEHQGNRDDVRGRHAAKRIAEPTHRLHGRDRVPLAVEDGAAERRVVVRIRVRKGHHRGRGIRARERDDEAPEQRRRRTGGVGVRA